MSAHSYSELNAHTIRDTIEVLTRRVEERFPGSGLSRVSGELLQLAEENELVVERLRRPTWWLRALIALAVAGVGGLLLWTLAQLGFVATDRAADAAELLQVIDAATSELLFLSIVLLFLVSLETRLKRRVALRMLHRLRSVAHVVDMHQLTKDPEHALRRVESTASSPARQLSRERLGRYLDYCSEMLSLTSKLAALHVQHLQDQVVLGAVNDIESLTVNLSRKIWQKITILDTAAPRSAEPQV